MRADTVRIGLTWVLLTALWTAPIGAQSPPTQLAPPTESEPPTQAGPRPLPPTESPTQAPPVTQGRPLDQRPTGSPIVLTPQQQAYLDAVLQDWEKNTSDIKTFRCTLVRWQYNPGFVAPNFKDKAGVKCTGELTYSAPDKGSFKITEVRQLNPETGHYDVAKDEVGEHWVCDGKSIWEYNGKLKHVIERPIPPEMQGKAITDGPLPFLFGAEAEKLKKRYFLQIITPAKYAETEIWVDGYPRFRSDAANFRRVILCLKRGSFEPYALQIDDPGNGRTAYLFENVRTNDPLEKVRDLFAPPRVPFGWRKVVELPPQAAQQPGPPQR